MPWILQEERDAISADHQDFRERVFVGPPREYVTQGHLSQDSPIDLSGVTRLTSALNVGDESISVDSTADFPGSGAIFVGTEFIEYRSKTATTFTSLSRINPDFHAATEVVQRFVDVTERVTGINLSGNIDSHEWTGNFRGVSYDWRLFRPDRSVYVEMNYKPAFGQVGPRVATGFGVVGSITTQRFELKDENGTGVEATGMDWDYVGNLWVVTEDKTLIRVHPVSGEILEQYDQSEHGIALAYETHSLACHHDLPWIYLGVWDPDLSLGHIYILDATSGETMTTQAIGTHKPTGMAYDGTYLWYVDDTSLDLVQYDIFPSPSYTNQVVQTLSAPDPSPDALAYWQGELWVLGGVSGRIYQVDRITGYAKSITELDLSNPKAIALSNHGGRIADDTNYVFDLKLGSLVGQGRGKQVISNVESVFTAPAVLSGFTYDDDGNLWGCSATNIYKMDSDGNVLDSFTSPVESMSCLSWVGAEGDYLIAGNSEGNKLHKIDPDTEALVQTDDSFSMTGSPTGLWSDTSWVFVVDHLGSLYVFDTDGRPLFDYTPTQGQFSGTTSVSARNLNNVNYDVYIWGTETLWVWNFATRSVKHTMTIPSTLQGLGSGDINYTYGHRAVVVDEVYSFDLTLSQDTFEASGSWSGWTPFYFGYIEQGSITATHLEKTWQFRTRSTWMYLENEEADGRNLAPENLAKFKPTRTSSVLADPALEIGTEYISTPGEGVSGQQAVDDEMGTLWISQDQPTMIEGPVPMPRPVYDPPDAPGDCDNYADVGRQVPPMPGTGIVENDRRRMIFTEIHKPRLGLRPAAGFWIEMRNMSDDDPANVIAGMDQEAFPQGFFVLTWTDRDGVARGINLAMRDMVPEGSNIIIGPEDFGSRQTCEKDWIVFAGDDRTFFQWWDVPSGTLVIDLHQVSTAWPLDTEPDGTFEEPLDIVWSNAQLKFYWMNGYPIGINNDNILVNAIGPDTTSLQCDETDDFPDRGFGMINNGGAYEWITWESRSGEFLHGLTRGVEGTRARAWPPGNVSSDTGLASGTRVWAFYGLGSAESLARPINPDGTWLVGHPRMQLSDWVDMTAVDAELGFLPHGWSFARDGFAINPWSWVRESVPQPAETKRPMRDEWIAVDLQELNPPLLSADITDTSATIGIKGDVEKLLYQGVIQIDQEWIEYRRDTSGTYSIENADAVLVVTTRGYDGTTPAAHEKEAQVWQILDRSVLNEHMMSGMSWHRPANASDGIPANYDIYITWRPNPRFPNEEEWRGDWNRIWNVVDNTQKNHAHFVDLLGDLDDGAFVANAPDEFAFWRVRWLMMVIHETNSGRAKINELKVYGANPRTNLLATSLDAEDGEDEDLTEFNNTVSLAFDYLVRGFGLDPREVSIVGPGVGFYELPVASGTYASILSSMAEDTGYAIWFNRWNVIWFMPDPQTRRDMPLMTNLDSVLLRDPIEIVARPSARISQVTVSFRNEQEDEVIEVSWPETPLSSGTTLSIDGLLLASEEQAREVARQTWYEENGQWEVEATFGVAPQFVLGHRYTVTYPDWDASLTYFQGQDFVVQGITFDISTGPEREWQTTVSLVEYHPGINVDQTLTEP